MVLLAKGYFMVIIGLTIACILSTTFAQQDSQTAAPVVLSASRVPVQGGLLRIYGRNFGTDASRVKVRIVEKGVYPDHSPSISPSSAGDIVACTNVEIIIPDTAISCKVANAGTGKSKHIIVTITGNSGLISSNDDDNNVAFSREAPEMQKLTYNVEEKKIIVAGTNFGSNASSINVALDGTDYPVLAAENNAITLRLLKKRRVDEINYQPPTSKLVYVTVDGQHNAANMSVALAVAPVTEEPVVAGKTGSGLDRSTVAGIVVGGVMGFALITLAVTLFVMKRNKRSDNTKQGTPPATDNSDKPGTAKVSGLENVQIGVTNEKAPPAPEVQTVAPSLTRPASNILQEGILSASDNMDKAVETPASNISLEEIDLREDSNNNLYEKNMEVLSDSSFSESSSDDISDNEVEEGEDHSSSFSAGDFSDASPAHSPDASPNKERRQQLQMSSEYPPGMFLAPQKSLRIQEAHSPSPSPPTLTRSALGQSSLRHAMVIPPPLELDSEHSSENSPLPSPAISMPSPALSRFSSSSTKSTPPKKGKKSKRGGRGGGMSRGMIRAPSSRLASSKSMSSVHHAAFDSPHL